MSVKEKFEEWFNNSRGEPKPKHRNETLEERQYREYYEDSFDGFFAGCKETLKDIQDKIDLEPFDNFKDCEGGEFIEMVYHLTKYIDTELKKMK